MSSATTPKTVLLSGDEFSIQHEAVAVAAILPGHLIERTSAATPSVQVHSDAGGVANLHFAMAYGITGRGIDDAYAAADNVIFRTLPAGASVYALLAAAATAVLNGGFLASAGDGTLRVAVDGDIVVAQAREAVDNSAGVTVARIRVELVAPQALNPAPVV